MKEAKNENNPQFWDYMYKADEAAWDLGGPTPFFEDLAKTTPAGELIVIGCGSGYDAITFAKYGFDVTAVDFAPSAIKNLRTTSRKENVKLKIIEQDIFSLIPEYQNKFDYIIEQTCFCAIHPSRRQEYERLVKKLLKTDGLLIGLWFPLDKKLDEGGPPYGTSIKELENTFCNGWQIISKRFSNLSVSSRTGKEISIVFQKQQ